MASYPGGWNTLQNSMPQSISDILSFAKYGATGGSIISSSVFNTPTGGVWQASPISISIGPIVVAVNGLVYPDQAQKAAAMNMQTKTYNANAPLPLKTLIFAYGNKNTKMDFQSDISLNLGGLNYNLLQLSILENAATKGDSHGTIQVVDFGAGPFTGIQTLSLNISGYFGPLNLGIRLESTPGAQSSMFDLRYMILQVPE